MLINVRVGVQKSCDLFSVNAHLLLILLIAKEDNRFENADEAKRRAFFLDFSVNFSDFSS